MPINKQFLKSRPEVKVTFAVEKEAAGDAEQDGFVVVRHGPRRSKKMAQVYRKGRGRPNR